MPVSCKHVIRPLSQQEFGEIAYEVIGHVFAVHHELGRLFDEKIYQAEIAHRITNAVREVPIDVTFGDFTKTFYIDLLVDGGAIFERMIGMQEVPQIVPDVAIRVTAVPQENVPSFEHHLRQFLRHTTLRVLQWVNLTRQVVQFKTLS
jgi:hypothetical protein